MKQDKHELPQTNSTEDSVVFVTMHKAGSVFVTRILADLMQLKGMPHVDFAGEAFGRGLIEWEYCVERSRHLATPGYFFGAFRGPYLDKLGDIGGSRAIAQVRDPRDCIVSLYFSYKFSHAKPGEGEQMKKFSEAREAAETMDIDTFSIARADEYRRRMKLIDDFLKRHDGALLLKYEDMITDFGAWYQGLCDFLKVKPGYFLRKRHAREASPKSASGDPNAHKRQMLPGDHRRKLKSATIEEMDRTLSGVLDAFGYKR